MLGDILHLEQYALGISPGFFQFYALTGVLHALEDNNCLKVTHVSGSSAGALVGGFLASGMSPKDMIDPILSIKREDIWDIGGFGGLLQGRLFQNILENKLLVEKFEECQIPVGITAWDVFGFNTKIITSGDLATAIRASCTFPGLFQPAIVDGRVCIDGGVMDDSGLMALPGVPPSELIVNIVCGLKRINSSKLPTKYPNARLLTIALINIPTVNPFTMQEQGPIAYKTARIATARALKSCHMNQIDCHHWVCYIDGKDLDLNSTPEKFIPNPNLIETHGLIEFISKWDIKDKQLVKSNSFTFLANTICQSTSIIHTSYYNEAENIDDDLGSGINIDTVSDISTNSNSHKRKIEMVDDDSILNINPNDSISDLLNSIKLKTISIGRYNIEYDEMNVSERIDLTNTILESSKYILLFISRSDYNTDKRNNRRSSKESKKWVVSKLVREAVLSERQIGFTHLVRLFSDSVNSLIDIPINLKLSSYYNMDSQSILKELKVSVPLASWVGVE